MPRLRRRSPSARRTRAARPLVPVALAAVFLLVAAACGDADDSATPSESAPAGNQAEPIGPAAPGADGPLPAVDVVDIATGSTVSLTSYNTGQRPLLVWFWAPH